MFRASSQHDERRNDRQIAEPARAGGHRRFKPQAQEPRGFHSTGFDRSGYWSDHANSAGTEAQSFARELSLAPAALNAISSASARTLARSSIGTSRHDQVVATVLGLATNRM